MSADVPEPISPWVRVLVVIDQNNNRSPARIARVATITGNHDVAQNHIHRLVAAARTTGHSIPNLVATQTAGTLLLPDDIINLIRDLTHDDPCTYDHNGNCQAHGWDDPDRACPHATAKHLNAAHAQAKENQ